MIKQSIESDLKQAMLAGDKELATILRTVKSVILDAEISLGKRDVGLEDSEIIGLLSKESKRRLDASKIYKDAGDLERANKEQAESQIILKYLPEMMGEDEIYKIVKEVIDGIDGEVSMQNMGQIIGQVKAKAGVLADGSLIAKVVKDLITK